jgi:hypothetical protein
MKIAFMDISTKKLPDSLAQTHGAVPLCTGAQTGSATLVTVASDPEQPLVPLLGIGSMVVAKQFKALVTFQILVI